LQKKKEIEWKHSVKKSGKLKICEDFESSSKKESPKKKVESFKGANFWISFFILCICSKKESIKEPLGVPCAANRRRRFKNGILISKMNLDSGKKEESIVCEVVSEETASIPTIG